jgi:hypothetical protein
VRLRARAGGAGTAALAGGLAVLLLTVASQVGLLGPHDFLTIAVVGLLGAVFCLAVALRRRSRAAVAGLVLSLLPVALLVYYVGTTAG